MPEAGAEETGAGYYEGLAFTYTCSHVEIVTEARESASKEVELPVELDAASLGLDRKIIQDHAEAMKVLQWELIRAHTRMGKGEDRPELLKEWIEEWRATNSADFLIGESWQRVNEALGYTYQSGLQSLPVTVGTVALQPLSPTRASMRLSIAIADMPQRTGRVDGDRPLGGRPRGGRGDIGTEAEGAGNARGKEASNRWTRSSSTESRW